MEHKKRDKRKQAAIHARMTDNEYRALEVMAGKEGRNLSDMVRALIVEGAKGRAIFPNQEEHHREEITG